MSTGMRDKHPLSLNLLVEVSQSVAISVDREAGYPPDQLTEKVHNRGHIEALDAESGDLEVNDLETRSLGDRSSGLSGLNPRDSRGNTVRARFSFVVS